MNCWEGTKKEPTRNQEASKNSKEEGVRETFFSRDKLSTYLQGKGYVPWRQTA